MNRENDSGLRQGIIAIIEAKVKTTGPFCNLGKIGLFYPLDKTILKLYYLN